MLRALRGRTHEVVTAVVLRLDGPGGREAAAAVTSRVLMRVLHRPRDRRLRRHGRAATTRPAPTPCRARAGSSSTRVEGCYTNVVGLPLGTTARLLRAFGLAPTERLSAAGGAR